MSENYSPVYESGYHESPLATPPAAGNGFNAPGARTDSATGSTTGSTADTAKEQAASVGQEAAQAGQHVAGVAKDQAAAVATETGQQVKELLSEAQAQLAQQSAAQQQKLVTGLRSVSDELSSMARGSERAGVATDLARQAGERTSALAGWLDGREPASVLNDVSAFARRRPGAFLGIAVGLGLLAGRLTRGLQAESKQPETQSATDGPRSADAAPTLAEPLSNPRPTNVDVISPSVTGVAVTDATAPMLVPPVPPTSGAGY